VPEQTFSTIMMKFVVLAAFVATALGQDASGKNVDADEANDDAIKAINTSLQKAQGSLSGVADATQAIADKMIEVDGLMGEKAELDHSLPTVQAMLKMQKDNTDDELAFYLNVAETQQQVMIDQHTNNLKMDVARKTNELQAFAKEVTQDTTYQAAKLADTASNLLARLNKHKECAKKLEVYNAETGECTGPRMPDDARTRKVSHRMFNNDDGRDSGYLSNREVTFTKTESNTYMRVWYHDNMRVHGHQAYGRWNIMVCDQNGNGCDHCNNPGRLQYWKYSHHQHNWWMNDHHNGGMTGLCKSAGNRNMGKGTFKFRVMIDHNRYDMYTGHNTHSMLMVDEVFKL